jgi:hypothetical protein
MIGLSNLWFAPQATKHRCSAANRTQQANLWNVVLTHHTNTELKRLHPTPKSTKPDDQSSLQSAGFKFLVLVGFAARSGSF